MSSFVPGAYLAAHPFLAYGTMFALGCVFPGLAFACVWATFAVTYGFNLGLILLIAIVGGWVNDGLAYWAGRVGSRVTSRIIAWVLPRRPQRPSRVRDWFGDRLNHHPVPYLCVLKSPIFVFAPGTPLALIGAIGALRFPYLRFVGICAPLSAAWMTAYVFLGAYIGPRVLASLRHVKPQTVHLFIALAAIAILARVVRSSLLPRLRAMRARTRTN